MIKDREKVGNDIYGVKSNWKLDQKVANAAETGFRHNDRYHKYFHGYTEVRIEKPNGRYAIERVYTDDWYAQDVTSSARIALKIIMPFLSIFTLVFYVWLMSLPNLLGNVSRIVALPGFTSIILLILLVASSIGYAFTKEKMTWWEQYSSRGRILRYASFSGIMMLITALTIVVNSFLSSEAVFTHELLLALGVAICAVVAGTIYSLEKNLSYKTIENNVVLPEGEAHLIL